MFRGTAELVPFDDSDAQWAFAQKRILKMNLNAEPEELEGALFIKLNPEPKVYCYGIGIGIMELRSRHIEGSYKVTIPDSKL